MKTNDNKIIVESILIIIIGILIFNNYIKSKKIFVNDYINNIIYEEKKEIENDDKIQNTIIHKNENDVIQGYIIIPKINLKKPFYNINSKKNNINTNIYIMKESKYPNEDKGNFIITSFSGNSWNSFFKKVHLIRKNDIIEVLYKNKKYIYKVSNMYVNKNKKEILIYRNSTATTLTLIVSQKGKNQQPKIYISELIKKESI